MKMKLTTIRLNYAWLETCWNIDFEWYPAQTKSTRNKLWKNFWSLLAEVFPSKDINHRVNATVGDSQSVTKLLTKVEQFPPEATFDYFCLV